MMMNELTQWIHAEIKLEKALNTVPPRVGFPPLHPYSPPTGIDPRERRTNKAQLLLICHMDFNHLDTPAILTSFITPEDATCINLT